MAGIFEVEQAINLLFRLLEVKDSGLAKESVDLLSDFHEVYLKKVKQTTKDADILLLGVPERSDFVRDIRLGLTGSFGALVTKHDQLRKLDKLSPSESQLDRILQADSENYMLDVCAKGSEITEKMEGNFGSLKSNLEIVRSVCSSDPKAEIVAGVHVPFLSCLSFVSLKTSAEMFCDQVWSRIYEVMLCLFWNMFRKIVDSDFQLSPQNLSPEGPPMANKSCVEFNGKCKEALGLLQRIPQLTVSFHDLAAENEGLSSVCRILKQLNSGRMSWSDFCLLYYPQNETDYDASMNPDRQAFPPLLERRSEMQKRLIEKRTEQMVAQTLLATIEAISLAGNTYDEIYPALLIYHSVLMGELALWEKLIVKCQDLTARRKAEDGAIKSHIDREEKNLRNRSAERLRIQEEYQRLNASVADEVRALNAVGLNLDISHMRTNVLENITGFLGDFGPREPVQKHVKLMQKLEELLHVGHETVQYVHANITSSSARRGRSSGKSIGQESFTDLNDSLSPPVWTSP